MAVDSETALSSIARYKECFPHSEGLLNLFETVLRIRNDHRASFASLLVDIDEEDAAKKLGAGLPLIDFYNDSLNLKSPKEYFTVLLKCIGNRGGNDTAEIVQMAEVEALDFGEMIREFFKTSRMEFSEDEDFDLSSFLLEESLHPAMERLACSFRHLVGGWGENFCPLCGREPRISVLRGEEGARFLYCFQCGFEWAYRRIRCPFCGNEDQNSLAYFMAGSDEMRRVDVCRRCNRYIKTVDSRKSESTVFLDVEHMATMHLDILARREHFR